MILKSFSTSVIFLGIPLLLVLKGIKGYYFKYLKDNILKDITYYSILRFLNVSPSEINQIGSPTERSRGTWYVKMPVYLDIANVITNNYSR